MDNGHISGLVKKNKNKIKIIIESKKNIAFVYHDCQKGRAKKSVSTDVIFEVYLQFCNPNFYYSASGRGPPF